MKDDIAKLKAVRERGEYAIRVIDAGHRSEPALMDLLAYAKQLKAANARHAINHIENICETCGHTKTEDGCAFCISNQFSNLPTIVCLCGSTRFFKTFQEQSLRLAKEGKIVLSIGAATASDSEHLANGTITQEDKARFDELHMRKIDLADEILVLNVGGYIGKSTKNEIDYAEKNGKKISYLDLTPRAN